MKLHSASEGVFIALASLRANKVRAALTILGVAIGVMVVMVIGALISGFNKGVSRMLEQSGPRTFYVARFWSAGPVISDGSDEASPWRHLPPLTVDEARRIAALPGISFVAVDEDAGGGMALQFGDQRTSSADVRGRSADWPKVTGGDVYPGRSFTAVEAAAFAPVAVVNQKLAAQLFGQLDPVGRTVKITGVPYTVIGVFNPPPSLFGEEDQMQVILPHSTFDKHVQHRRGWMDFLVAPTESVTVQAATDEVTTALRTMRGLRPGQLNNFSVVTQDKFLESFNKTTLMFRVVMFVLSSVGLIVGGVGVVAIMMISVTERTREIGVRKALGATKREILWQFLVEAATLTLVGGAIGMILGGLIAFAVAHLTPIPANVPLLSIVAALAAAAFTGIVFGLYPASRAARLDPVEALRYE